MLPKHPGHLMGKVVDPLRGQSLAYNPGRNNAVGDKAPAETAVADVDHAKHSLDINRLDKPILVEKPGAGILPKVEGPAIKIDPPVKSATAVHATPK